MMKIETESISLKASDGTEMRAYLARPEDNVKRPGMLVFQEAFGVNSHIREVTERLAREGWVALAPELFHRTASGFEGSYTDFQSVLPHMQALTEAGLEADLRAAYAGLRAVPQVDAERIASVGFCMGGRVSFLADSILPLRAAISFYGGGIGPGPQGKGLLDRAGDLHAPILLFWGGLDKHIPPEQHRAVVDAFRLAGKQFVNVEFSDADHGFFCDARASYNPTAARQAWALALQFFAVHVG